MRYAVASIVAFTLLATFAIGCSSDPTSPSASAGATTITAGQTAGNWTLLSMQPTGHAEQTVPTGASYELTLADGRVSTKADCNVCDGSLVFAGPTLMIGPMLACTRAACPTMDFGNTYVAILEGDSTPRIDGNVLTLTSSRGVIRFRR